MSSSEVAGSLPVKDDLLQDFITNRFGSRVSTHSSIEELLDAFNRLIDGFVCLALAFIIY